MLNTMTLRVTLLLANLAVTGLGYYRRSGEGL